MEETEIKKLLGVQKQTGERGRRCPDEIQLAAYVAKRLDNSASAAIESHIADCDFCLSQLAFLTQPVDVENLDQVPSSLLARARGLLTKKPKHAINWGWRLVAPSAAAACIVLLVVVVVVQLRKRETVSPGGGPFVAQQNEPLPITSPQVALKPAGPISASPTPLPKTKSMQTTAVRSKTSEEIIPRLLAPREGAAIRREDLEVRWQQLSDAMFYEVRIMSATGDVVYEQQTENTSMKPGPAALLVPGTKYFIVVSAHLRQGKTEKSAVVSFRLTGQ